MVRRLRYWPITKVAEELAEELLATRAVPDAKPLDALQIAICAAHEMDYLLTWNYAHMANPIAQDRLAVLCFKRRVRVPLLVSPESIPSVRLGQSIRRRD